MVNRTLLQTLRLCTGRTARRRSRGIDLPFLDHGTRRGRGASVTTRPLFTPGKDQVPIVQKAGWAPGPVWTGAEIFTPPGFDPRTVQPAASSYTVYTTLPTGKNRTPNKYTKGIFLNKVPFPSRSTIFHHLLP
jgi:hypothetical protein